MHILPFFGLLFPHLGTASLANALIASVWQGLLLTAAVALSLRLLPGLSSAVRSAVWTAVLLLLVLLPALPVAVSRVAGPQTAILHLEEGVSFALVLLWACASAFRLVQLCGSAWRLHGILHRATPVVVPEAAAALLHVGVQPGSRSVILCTSADVDRPSVAGFFRPRILLPESLLTTLSEAELSQIILHETEHLRRLDDWVNLAQQISLVLFPLNPALLWLNRRLALERELACDDGVLKTTRARKAYAACLARVAENTLFQRGVSLALGIVGDWRRRSELARRVERILSAPAPAMSRIHSRLASGVLCAGLLGGAGLLAHCPELVAFGPAAGSGFAQATTALALPLSQPGSQPVSSLGMAHPMLVKAIMPNRATQPLHIQTQTTAPRLHRTHLRVNPHRSTRQAAAPWVVLTSWRSGTPNRSAVPVTTWATPALDRLTPVVFATSQAWYTAVPWQGGWLVVQL